MFFWRAVGRWPWCAFGLGFIDGAIGIKGRSSARSDGRDEAATAFHDVGGEALVRGLGTGRKRCGVWKTPDVRVRRPGELVPIKVLLDVDLAAGEDQAAQVCGEHRCIPWMQAMLTGAVAGPARRIAIGNERALPVCGWSEK